MSDPADAPTDNPRSTRDWLVDLCVYAPIGFALDASRYLPEFATKGRDQVAAARFLGRFAVQRLETQLGPFGPLLKSVIGNAPTQPTAADPAMPPQQAPPSAPNRRSDSVDQDPLDDADPAAPLVATSPSAAAGPAPASTLTSAASPTPTLTTPRRAPRTAGSVRPAGDGETAATAPKRTATAARPRKTPAAGEVAPAPGTATKSARPTRPTRPTKPTNPPRPSRPAKAPARAESAAATPAELPVFEADLAIEGYANLSASQVVPRLATLSAAELASIDRFERDHRARRTILNRVAQLQAEG
ncbi:MAG: hypothetical protein ACKV2O_09055 [Acidimicrobiales bacterium]